MVYINQSCQAQTRPTFSTADRHYSQVLAQQLKDRTDRHDKSDTQIEHRATSCRTSHALHEYMKHLILVALMLVGMPSKWTDPDTNTPP